MMPFRHRSLIPLPSLRRALAILSAIVAIATLPVCHPALLEPYGDIRTVTEARSVVETFSSPGTILLHQQLHGQPALNARCAACESVPATSNADARGDHVLTEIVARAAVVSGGPAPTPPAGQGIEPPARLAVPRGIVPSPELRPPIPGGA